MIAKKYKIPLTEPFKKTKFIQKTPYFILKINPSALTYGRCGVVVPKKFFAAAVTRNRLKRIIFSVFQKKIIILPAADYLIILSTKAAAAPKERLIKTLEEVLEKIQT